MINSRDNHSFEVKDILAYILICLIWGSAYPVNRIGISTIPPLFFLGWRLFLAGFIVLLFYGKKRLLYQSLKDEFPHLVIPGLLMFLGGNGLGILGLRTVSSGPSALLVAVAPVFMALLDLAKPGTPRMSWTGWVGLLLGFGGVASLLITGSATQAVEGKGACLILGGAFCWALGSIYNNRVQSKLPAMVQMAGQMASGGLALLILGVIFHGWYFPVLTWQEATAFVYLLIFDGVTANSLYLYLLRVWPSTRVGTYAYITPFIAGLIGFIFLDEPLSLKLIGSGISTLGGVFLVQKSYGKRVQEG